MAGQPGRSGGANRIAPALHLARGTFRPDRHGQPDPVPVPPLSDRVRRQALRGLSVAARRLAGQILAEYPEGWDAAALTTLRLYVESSARLTGLQDQPAQLHREIRINLKLLHALDLDR